MLGGWEISGASQFQTGTPCGIGTNADFAGVGDLAASVAAQGSILGAQRDSDDQCWRLWRSDDHITQPAAGTINLQHGVRDSVYQPGLRDWTVGLLKTFTVHDRSLPVPRKRMTSSIMRI